ncbi:hypothetical protein V5799_029837, partial [Amblyomma americanum]
MHYIASAWDEVSADTIANSFKHCGFKRSDASPASEAVMLEEAEAEFGNLQLPVTFADYVGADDDVAVCNAVSLEEVMDTMCPDDKISDEEEVDDDAEVCAPNPSYADVLQSVDNIRRFACARDDVGDLLSDVAALERKLMRRGWAK